jgi:hypothetical protein
LRGETHALEVYRAMTGTGHTVHIHVAHGYTPTGRNSGPFGTRLTGATIWFIPCLCWYRQRKMLMLYMRNENMGKRKLMPSSSVHVSRLENRLDARRAPITPAERYACSFEFLLGGSSTCWAHDSDYACNSVIC